ncbi:MAG: A/G-specific adenine glycosylase, partial [Myxococcales bacterium]|nr:A/G-specific adenine glycosylase [Myxococcales bacterium]
QAWSGLGYYRRARLLHRGARYVLDECGGVVPGDATSLRAVPGVGRYTAGAITSIAFDSPAALVDGNVARVVSRLLAIREPERQGANNAIHWDVAQAVLERGSPRVLAQALMELGATVCTPTSPRCASCPVRASCGAHAEGLVDTIPAPRKKIAQPEEDLWALAVFWRGRLLLERRPEQGLLAGLWCLPLVTQTGTKTAKKTAKKAA